MGSIRPSQKSLVIPEIVLIQTFPEKFVYLNMLEQGIVLMVVGMGVVFCFLILLVLAVQIMGVVLRNIVSLEPEPASANQVSAMAQDDSAIVAVAAAQRHRSSRN